MLSSIRQVVGRDAYVLDLAPASVDHEMREAGETRYLADVLDKHLKDQALPNRTNIAINLSQLPAISGWEISDFLAAVATIVAVTHRLVPIIHVSEKTLTRIKQRCAGTYEVFADEDSAIASFDDQNPEAA